MGMVRHKERCPANPKVKAFVDWWDVHGPFIIVIVAGNRDDENQLEDFKKGRKKLPDGSWLVVNKAAVVTHALRAADSAHGHAAAIDAHPVRALYDSGGVRLIYLGDEKEDDVRAEALRLFKIYNNLARAHGLEAGDVFPNLVDRPHVQDPAWRTLPLAPGVAS